MKKPTGTTHRAVIGMVAALAGGNARIDENDLLRIVNGTLLATFPNGVNLKTSLGIGVSSATGAISAINAIDNCIYSAGSMHTGNYILDMVFKRA